ncbi:MAG: hypothetical protein A2W52_00065 [Candidatus Taylorbacteria bacterium RIFCSPHIGHO2_02_49_25]|uniref:Uncharacterized protein n=1 Tax=Candidatus Taylorbacteria bacterium RIFCSPHIGHO2_02_49_25 TaxID=1802305 RepID=A0A1G2MCB9_9BACT|nr:MAG: hypothetical protein UY62_C0029G0005 [Parcubacteria group bacterium GW2011_GWF2_50_9]OHA21354.1 MAG: hypothetical protein A2W52_00065 [Candidatus Taylorbacteria bacterium RIFCSPHIGHO2_02_49_25]OHA21618.1 MAG: hypothetical protein A2759_01925 [Candidatus Taylorbacteria bacterium RIFCSPHIGHO2_01_FULL_49_60]OHA35418.1 MAG: hypothetical protein A2W65_04890 [Candidatus Taylorbacteria bacterium RIFCSPLOWO2_02_50_13]OHA36953.1 MAG: hypothetical protein A3B27_00060 [Candidatus Taylorbacteria ba
MPEKFPEQNSPNTERQSGMKEKLQKVVALGAIGVTALAGEACSPDKGDEGGQAGGQSKSVEIQKDRMLPNPALLAEYHKNIREWNFPSKGQKERIIARALEISINRGLRIDKESRVEVEARGTVPVAIKIDGQPVPVGPGDYTAEELKLVRMVEGISRSMGNASDRNIEESLGSEEKISPLADKVFNQQKNPPKSGIGGKIYTSPDFEDF